MNHKNPLKIFINNLHLLAFINIGRVLGYEKFHQEKHLELQETRHKLTHNFK